MTQQAPETAPQQPPAAEEGLSAYEVALAALVAAAVAETAAVWERFVPGLVEEVPPRARRLLVATLARSWAVFAARGHALAALTGSAVTGCPPVDLPEVDEQRWLDVATSILDRAVAMDLGADRADPRPLDDAATLEADLAALTRRRAEEHAEALAVAQAEVLRLETESRAVDESERAAIKAEMAEAERLRDEEEAAEREALADLLRAEAAADAADVLREADERAADAEEQRRAEEADRAEQRAIDEDYFRTRRADAEQRRTEAADARRAARAEARRERRRAQRARAENVARAETSAAAAETLPVAMAEDPRQVGWVRKINNGACERCTGWWQSGGEARGATPVRPWSVKMKRHHGCTCTQRPVTREEADRRGYTDEPEPVIRTNRAAREQAARHRADRADDRPADDG